MEFFVRIKTWIARQDFWGLTRSWRFLTPQKILYFPYLLSPFEKRLAFLLAGAALVSGGLFFGRLYVQFTRPVPKISGSYTEGILGEPRVINPIYDTQDVERDISRLVYAGLVSYDEHGKMTMDMAERIEVSEDGRQYRVILKPNLSWHDGEPVRAEDAAFTVRAIQNPQYKSPLRPNWQGITVEAANERTIVFTLRSAYAPFLENLKVGILPKHVWEHIPVDQAFLHERNLKPVGSGPYVFSSFTKNREGSIVFYDLVRNPRYHGQGPYLKRIRLAFFRRGEDVIAAWRRGTIEGLSPVGSVARQEIESRNSVNYALTMPRVFGIFFNLNGRTESALDDKRVREAIAHAIDRRMLVDSLSGQTAEPIESPFSWINGESAGSEETTYPFRPDAARELLEQAGWRDQNGDGIREKRLRLGSRDSREPENLRFTLATSDWQDLAQVSDLIQHQLRDVGIDVAVEKKPFAELESSVIRSRDFDMLLFGHVYGYEPDPFAFWHSSQIKDPGLNITAYSNRRADALLEEARLLTERSKRNRKFRDIQTLILNDLPALFLYAQSYSFILPRDLEGVSLSRIALPADRFSRVQEWYRDTRRVLR